MFEPILKPDLQNHYAVLGIDNDPARAITEKEIKSAYWKASLKHHPDKPGGDHAEFLKIQMAHDALLANLKQREDNIKLETQKHARHEPTTGHAACSNTNPPRSRRTNNEPASSGRTFSTKTGHSKYDNDSYKWKSPSDARPAPSPSHFTNAYSSSPGQYAGQDPYDSARNEYTGYGHEFSATGYEKYTYDTQPREPQRTDDELASRTRTYKVKTSRSKEARQSPRRRPSVAGPTPSDNQYTESWPSSSERHASYTQRSSNQTRPAEYGPSPSFRNEFVETVPVFTRNPTDHRSYPPTGTPEDHYNHAPIPQTTDSRPRYADSIKSRSDSCPHHQLVQVPDRGNTFTWIRELREDAGVLQSDIEKLYKKMNPAKNNHGPRTVALCTSIYEEIVDVFSDTRQTLDKEILKNRSNTTNCERAEMDERLSRTDAIMKKWARRVKELSRTLKEYERPKTDSKERQDLQNKFVVLLAGWEKPEPRLIG